MKKAEVWKKIVFFGALWGFLEATLGYGLQFLPPMVSGLIMFPVAVLILTTAYSAIGNRSSLMAIGLVAAGIKAIDLLLPGLMPMKTINPMVAIIIEAAIVAIAVPLVVRKKPSSWLAGSILMSVGWRLGFVLFMYATYVFTGTLAKWLGTLSQGIDFILVDGLMASALVLLVIGIKQFTFSGIISIKWLKWSHSIAFAVLALIITFAL